MEVLTRNKTKKKAAGLLGAADEVYRCPETGRQVSVKVTKKRLDEESVAVIFKVCECDPGTLAPCGHELPEYAHTFAADAPVDVEGEIEKLRQELAARCLRCCDRDALLEGIPDEEG